MHVTVVHCSAAHCNALHCTVLLYHLPHSISLHYLLPLLITELHYSLPASHFIYWIIEDRRQTTYYSKINISGDCLLLRSSFSSSFLSLSFLSDTDPYCCIRSIQSWKKVLPPLKIAPIEICSFCWSWSIVKYLCNPLTYVNNIVQSKFKCNKNPFQSNTLPLIESFTSHIAHDQYFSSSIDLDCWKYNIC